MDKTQQKSKLEETMRGVLNIGQADLHPVPYIQTFDEKVYNSDIQHSLQQKILGQDIVENI